MVFDYSKEKSLYNEDDEFGIQEYRLDSNYVFDSNIVPVKIIRYNEEKSEDLSGSFLGDTLESSYPDDNYEIIDVNIMSRNPTEQEITEYGYDGKGVVIYEGIVSWDVTISNKDIIEFVGNYGLDIKAGERFRIKIEDTGIYQGQFTRKQFTLTKIENYKIESSGETLHSYKKETSLFDDGDELGLQEYRLDSSYIFNANLTPIKLIRYNEEKAEDLTSDFLGTTLEASYIKDNYVELEINIVSQQPSQKDITEYGYDGKEIIVYEGYANWDLKISNKDIIEFVGDFGLNTKAGEGFRIELGDAGLYQGQFTRKQFTLIKIQDYQSIEFLTTHRIIDELGNFMIDESGNSIVYQQ